MLQTHKKQWKIRFSIYCRDSNYKAAQLKRCVVLLSRIILIKNKLSYNCAGEEFGEAKQQEAKQHVVSTAKKSIIYQFA